MSITNNINNYFIESLLPPLSEEELCLCFEKLKLDEGGEQYIEIRNKIIMHNLRLVIVVINRYDNIDYPKEDLFSIGTIGLIKSVDTFDMTKKIKFSTYASTCISNEMKLFFRKYKQYINTDSIDQISCTDTGDNQYSLLDKLEDKSFDLVSEYEDKQLYIAVKQLVERLPEYDSKILMLYFGFNNREYSQLEISKMVNLSQSRVSRIIKKNLKILKIQLEELGYMEFSGNKLLYKG